MNIARTIERAKAIANNQGRLAASPGDRLEDGSVHLCAASCIARAAIELGGDLEWLAHFDAEVLECNKMDLIPSVFARAGLKADWARQILQENDSHPEVERLPWFNSVTELQFDAE